MSRGATRKQVNTARRGRLGRWLRALAGALALASIAGALSMGLWQWMQMPVERVMVSGELQQVDRAALQQRIRSSLNGGFLLVELEPLRDSVEALPWVYRAVIKRRWPNSLDVVVTEQTPIARWAEQGLLNHAGALFTPGANGNVANLPLLSGPPGSETVVMNYYKQVQDGIQDLDLELQALVMDARGGLLARLRNNGELVLGRGDIAAKLQRFRVIYQRELKARAGEVRSVDLRYSHGAAVAWHEHADVKGQES